MRVVINDCYGGFGLSPPAIKEYYKRKEGKDVFFYKRKRDKYFDGKDEYAKVNAENDLENGGNVYTISRDLGEKCSSLPDDVFISARNIERDDPILIKVIEDLGEKANAQFAYLKIIKIPDDVDWEIEEYDGIEWVAEKHRIWN